MSRRFDSMVTYLISLFYRSFEYLQLFVVVLCIGITLSDLSRFCLGNVASGLPCV
jgi:hypothetical protein